MIEHPELTDERRARIVARCEEQLSSMLAEAEEWYPDKRMFSEQLRKEHDGFCKRLGSLASDMGYGSFVELLHNEGYDIELDPRAAANPVGHRIAPEEAVDSIVASVTGKLGSYFDKIDEWYPDRVVAGFAKLHGKTKDNLSKQAQALGYISWAELLQDYGYEVPDYGAKVGRPVTTDPVAVVDELARRYEGREPAADVNALKEENPDLAPKLKSVANRSKAIFGKTFGDVLSERGIVRGRGARRQDAALDAHEAESILSLLAEIVSRSDTKPKTVAELRKLLVDEDADLNAALDSMALWSKAHYGQTPARLLKGRGILSGGTGARPKAVHLDDSEVESIIGHLRDKYAHAVRPRTASEFAEANPEWKEKSRAIRQYLGKRGLGTPTQYLAKEGLVSKVSRDDSIPRPGVEELSEFISKVGACAVELQRRVPSSTITEFESQVIGDERFGTPPAYEMLRVGDYVELSATTDGYVHVGFCGHDLGLIGMDERIAYRLVSRVRYSREWGMAGGRVYAHVTEIAGGPKKPRANLHVFFVEDESSSTIADGLLMSFDGKAILDCVEEVPRQFVIPEGVTVIGPDAFSGQSLSEVSLPSTLREIGDRAFYSTRLTSVTIPSGVERIGLRAFTHSGLNKSFYMGSESMYRCDDGPVKIEVARGNAHYESLDGSLVELGCGEKRLLSLYYRRPGDNFVTISIPRGVTVLGPSCIEGYDSVWEARLRVPEGVVRMEAGCLDCVSISHSSLPATLVDIDPFVWIELCGFDSMPYIAGVAKMPEGPLELDMPPCLRVAKGNPRYSVKGNKATALPATRQADGSLLIIGRTEGAEDAVEEGVEEVCFTYEAEDGKGFDYSFKFPQRQDDDYKIVGEYWEWL